MNYAIEIEEDERTLEFMLEVECNYWNVAAHTSGPPEDCCEGDSGFEVKEWSVGSIEITNEDGDSIALEDGVKFVSLKNEYYLFIGNILDHDDKLFGAWKKHVEEL